MLVLSFLWLSSPQGCRAAGRPASGGDTPKPNPAVMGQLPVGEIKLLAPAESERAFYATVAWTTPSTTTDRADIAGVK